MNLFEARADWPIPPVQTPAVKVENAEVPPRVPTIPCVMVLPKPQNNKPAEENVHGDHTSQFAKRKRKKAWKIGMVTNWKISRGTTTHKTLSMPKPMMFLIDIQSRSC